MAFAMGKPCLLFIEEGVTCDGFMKSMSTYKTYNRETLSTSKEIESIVASIHALRMESFESNIIPDQEASGFYQDRISYLVELLGEPECPLWRYTNSRILVFTRTLEGHIVQGSWAKSVPETVNDKIDYTLKCLINDSPVEAIQQVYKDTPRQLQVGLDFPDKPSKDDSVKIEFVSSSPFFNKAIKADVMEKENVGGRSFDCVDGLVPTQPTKRLHVLFRFPSWYKVNKKTLLPFVGSYSGDIDYLVESEIKRCNISKDEFGSNLQVDLRIESPLLRHIYGVAWNLDE